MWAPNKSNVSHPPGAAREAADACETLVGPHSRAANAVEVGRDNFNRGERGGGEVRTSSSSAGDGGVRPTSSSGFHGAREEGRGRRSESGAHDSKSSNSRGYQAHDSLSGKEADGGTKTTFTNPIVSREVVAQAEAQSEYLATRLKNWLAKSTIWDDAEKAFCKRSSDALLTLEDQERRQQELQEIIHNHRQHLSWLRDEKMKS